MTFVNFKAYGLAYSTGFTGFQAGQSSTVNVSLTMIGDPDSEVWYEPLDTDYLAYLAAHQPLAFTGPTDSRPSWDYWFGTTSFGQDVFAQFVAGLRAAFLVGLVGGGLAWILGSAVGFTAGFRGGWIDDVLSMLTNVVLVIPTLAILIIVAAYVDVHSYVTEAILIGLTSWPWAARAVRAQTFSLKTREFVDIARLSGRKTWSSLRPRSPRT